MKKNTSSLLYSGTWIDKPAHPWRRFFARMLDLYICGLTTFSIIITLISVISQDVTNQVFQLLEPPLGSIFDSVLVSFLAIFLTAASIGWTGRSIGKWFFGICVCTSQGNQPGLMLAIRREWKVFVDGFAIGIPLIQLICMRTSYKLLKKNEQTSWDQELNLRVQYRTNDAIQIIKSILGFIILILIIFIISLLPPTKG